MLKRKHSIVVPWYVYKLGAKLQPISGLQNQNLLSVNEIPAPIRLAY